MTNHRVQRYRVLLQLLKYILMFTKGSVLALSAEILCLHNSGSNSLPLAIIKCYIWHAFGEKVVRTGFLFVFFISSLDFSAFQFHPDYKSLYSYK